MSQIVTNVEPVSICGYCGVSDTEPKHTIAVGYNNPATDNQMFHEHDADRDGVIHYHFDCPTPWHSAVNPDFHAKIAALCAQGIKGDALRARIVEGNL